MLRKKLFILGAIIFCAWFLRFWRLDQLPPGLYIDEAVNGVNTLQAINNIDFKVFYPENNGREGLFINLQALSVQIFGATPWALRAVSAFIGTLTVLAFYFLLKEFLLFCEQCLALDEKTFRYFKNHYFALIGAFLLAFNSWHIHFSRIGFRAITLPLILSLAVLFLLRAMRQDTLKHFAVSGFFWGLGLYSYIGFRLAALFGVLLFAFDGIRWWLGSYTRTVKQFLIPYLILGSTAAIIAIPMIGYLLAHPKDIANRSSEISIFGAENPALRFLVSVTQTLIMFNVIGDWNWRHNLAGAPQLTFIVGILFLLGILIVLKDTAFAWKQKNVQGFFPFLFIGGWFVVMLMPAILTQEGLPHALRTIGVLPAVIMFATVGLISCSEYIASQTRNKLPLRFIVLTFLFLIASEGIYRYFFAWGTSNNLNWAFRQDLVDMAHFINSQNQDDTKYVIVNEGDVELDGVHTPSADIRYLTREDPSVQYLNGEHIDQVNPLPEHPAFVLFTIPDSGLEKRLYQRFPLAKKIQQPVEYYQIQ